MNHDDTVPALVGHGVVEALDTLVVAPEVLHFAPQHAGSPATKDADRRVGAALHVAF